MFAYKTEMDRSFHKLDTTEEPYQNYYMWLYYTCLTLHTHVFGIDYQY